MAASATIKTQTPTQLTCIKLKETIETLNCTTAISINLHNATLDASFSGIFLYIVADCRSNQDAPTQVIQLNDKLTSGLDIPESKPLNHSWTMWTAVCTLGYTHGLCVLSKKTSNPKITNDKN